MIKKYLLNIIILIISFILSFIVLYVIKEVFFIPLVLIIILMYAFSITVKRINFSVYTTVNFVGFLLAALYVAYLYGMI